MSMEEKAREIVRNIAVDIGDWDGWGQSPDLEDIAAVEAAILAFGRAAHAEGAREMREAAAETAVNRARHSFPTTTEYQAGVFACAHEIATLIRALEVEPCPTTS